MIAKHSCVRSILCSRGETASGKTETTRLLLKSLVDLAAPIPGKKGNKLITSIPSSFFLLDSFGSATTVSNTNASRFGRYSEVHFSDKGRVVGLKGLEYYLEKSRVTGASAGERNFHVFYYLVAGANVEERNHLRLDDSTTTFRYLSHHRSSATSSPADAVRFDQLKEAFKMIGFPKKAVASILQLLSAILHLGNIDFYIDRHKNADSAVVKNPYVLNIVAELLGVDPAGLEFVLTNKSMLVGREMCGIFLDPEGAASNRDDLARTLYGLIFSWIGEFLNEKLCRDDFATFIAIVDFPGAISASSHRETSAIDSFCFNLASERAHAFSLHQLYESSKPEYVAEGLDSVVLDLNISYSSNADCIKVLDRVPGGLVHIIDDQSRRSGKTDASMVKAMAKRWSNSTSFSAREGNETTGRSSTFTCTHWNGPVEYSSEGFLAHNAATLSPIFVDLLGGTSSTSGSSFSFVRQLFTTGAIQMVSHPQNEETIVGVTQNVAPRRAPSTRRPKGGRRPSIVETTEEDTLEDDAEGGAVGGGESLLRSDGRSVVKSYNDSLTILFDTMATTKSWFILCLRPNDAQLPNQVDAKFLKHQIRAFGLAELTKRLQGEWMVNLEFKEWWDRYEGIPAISSQIQTLAHLPYRDKALKVRDIMGWREREMGVGKNKVSVSLPALSHRQFDTDLDYERFS